MKHPVYLVILDVLQVLKRQTRFALHLPMFGDFDGGAHCAVAIEICGAIEPEVAVVLVPD